MRIGLIGAGNMAGALAAGWGEPVLVADPDAERAAALADAVGGEVVSSNGELVDRAELVVLCHKPAQLAEVAEQTGGSARAVASILWGTPVADLERSYPGVPVYRFMPNIPVEVGRGVLGYVRGSRAGEGPEREVLELFGRLGSVVDLDEGSIDAAGAVMSCGPAFFALVAEALAAAGASHGLPARLAARLSVETMAGTAAVLDRHELDMAGLRVRVASPGGVTARGLQALEAAGLRAAFEDAVAAVLSAERP